MSRGYQAMDGRPDYAEIVRLEKEIYGEPITTSNYRGTALDDPDGECFVLPLYLPHLTIVPPDPCYSSGGR